MAKARAGPSLHPRPGKLTWMVNTAPAPGEGPRAPTASPKHHSGSEGCPTIRKRTGSPAQTWGPASGPCPLRCPLSGEPPILPHLPASADALLLSSGSPFSFTSLSSAKRLGSRTTLFSISLTRGSITLTGGSITSLPGAAAFTWLTSWDAGESRVGLNCGSFSTFSLRRLGSLRSGTLL